MPASIDTRYGGLLFVLNAALQLSLYGDFSMPAQRGIACPPWRLLLLAGRAWCGAGFRADPLAGWLARRDSACGAPPDPDWRLDAAWLAPFLARQAPWRAAWQDGRFRLLHPAGFVVCDVAATIAQCDGLLAGEMLRLGLADPPRVQCAVVSRAAGTGARSGAPRHRHGCPNLLWPYLHARLALALDDGGASPKRRRIASMLTLPARLQDSGDRTDLYFSLAALPLAVRLAGLDRDPGWIPAASCDFRFHFG
jgi:hypothetical protein